MNTKIKIIAFMFLSITFFSCSNSEDDVSNLELENMTFKELKINFNEDTVLKFSKNDLKKLNKTVSDLNLSFNKAYEEDSNLKMITYQIIMTDEGIEIKDFNLMSPLMARNGQYTDWDAEAAWKCPTGTSQVGSNCYTQECVEANISTAFQGFSSGQTINLTVHHGGALGGGVKVCK